MISYNQAVQCRVDRAVTLGAILRRFAPFPLFLFQR